MSSDNSEFLDDFVTECREKVEEIEPKIISATILESALINDVLRSLHSLKGAAGFLGLPQVSSIIHEIESYLSQFRDQGPISDPKIVEVVIKSMDLMREILEHLSANRTEVGLETRFQKFKEYLHGVIQSKDGANSEPAKLQSAEQKNVYDETFQLFLAEAREHFQTIEESVIQLKNNSHNSEVLEKAFRSAHSFKGNCGMLNFRNLEKLCRILEDIFDVTSKGRIDFTTPLVNTVLSLVDMLSSVVQSLEKKSSSLQKAEDPEIPNLEAIDDLVRQIIISEVDRQSETSVRLGDRLLELGKITTEQLQKALLLQKESSKDKPLLGEILVEQGAVEADEVEEVLKEQTEVRQAQKEIKTQLTKNEPLQSGIEPQLSTAKKAGAFQIKDIRVSIEKLDLLSNLVGELVTGKTMLTTLSTHMKNAEEFEKVFAFLGRVTSDLQDVSVSLRMVPLAGLFRKMIRVVHDLSQKTGKELDLNIFGEDTEIDKTLVEQLSDPLVHMIRNAGDHGVEPTQDRIKVGKSKLGKITLGAKNESGEVWIIVKDDGRGIDRTKIIAKAQKMGVLTTDGSELTDNQVYQMLFLPGFSTAEKVTDISGRGVGMDVVLQNIKAINGRVEVASKLGEGTTFTIKIPLTMSILNGMLVQLGDQKFSIPLEQIRESFDLETTGMNTIMQSQRVIQFRGRQVPVLFLDEVYYLNANKGERSSGIIMVLGEGDELIALYVDEILGQHQAVVKPLPHYIKRVKGLSGCTVLGNGELSLILDVRSLVELALERLQKERKHEFDLQ